MLNYRNTSVAFLICTLAFFVSGVYISTIAVYIYSLIVLLYLFLLTLGAARIQMNFYLKAIINGNTNKAKVAITFDDGPDVETTENLLNILEKHQIKAAFFCIGSKINGNEQILREVVEKGHIVGNHSWSHAYLFDFYLPGRMIREINQTDAVIENVTNSQVKYFRPPFGVTNPFLLRALKKTGHTVIGWSLKTFDTTSNSQNILYRIESQLKNGDIILLHDANRITLNLLEEIIQKIKEKGFEIIGLDDLINVNTQG